MSIVWAPITKYHRLGGMLIDFSFKLAVSASRGFILLHNLNALPLPGDPRPRSVWDISGPSWAFFETRGIEALPKCI